MSHTPVSSISFDDVQAFLKESDTTEECLACESSNIGLMHDTDTTPSLVLTSHKEGLSPQTATFPTAIVICKDCGFIRLHAIGAVMAWKNALA